MSFKISEVEVKKINSTLGSEAKEFDGAWTWTLKSPDNVKPLVFSIYNNIDLGGQEGSMVSVQTRHGYYELHGITSIMFFEPDEVILIREESELLSCLIIGSGCTCSLYSNIRRSLLKADFAELHPAVLLAAMQLSITESVME